MEIKGCVGLVTGGNRGIGEAFVRVLLESGAQKVYAGSRDPAAAAHLVEQVIPWVPTRQWVVSVPIPLRYWTAPSKELTAKVHTIIRTTIAQY